MRILLILLLALAGNESDESLPPDPNAALADRVLVAFEAADRAALEAIARPPALDGWRVVEELCARGRLDAAAAFAELPPGIQHQRLPEYLEQWRALPPERLEEMARFHRRIGQGEALMRANRHADAAANLKDLTAPPGAPATFAIRIAGVRGLCRWGSQDLEGAIPDFLDAAEKAERLGWHFWEFLCVRGAAYCTWLARGATPALPLAERLLRVAPSSGQTWAVPASHELLAGLLLLEGKPLRALAHFEELIRLRPQPGANILLDTGRACSRAGDHLRAAEFMRRAVEALPAAGGDVTVEILVRVELALELHHLARYEEAERLLRHALEASRAAKRKELESRALMGLGLLLRTRGELSRALARFEEARICALAGRDALAISTATGLIGTCHHAIGDHRRAIQSQKQALFMLGFMKAPAAIAAIQDFLGLVYLDTGELDEAEKAHRKALALREEAGDLTGRVSTLRQLAAVLRRQGKPGEAAAILEEVRDLRRDRGDRAGQAMACVELARCRLDLGETDAAGILLAEAESLGEEVGMPEILAHTRAERARMLFDEGDVRAACAMARRAMTALPGLVGGYGDVQGAMARSEWAALLEVGLNSARLIGDTDSLCFFLEGGRAGGMLEWLTDREALRAAVLPEDLQQALAAAEAGVRATRIYLADATRRGDLTEKEEHSKALKAAGLRLAEVAEKAQRTRKSVTGTSHVEVRSLERIRKALRPDEALVVQAFANPVAFALVVTPGETRPVALGPVEDIRVVARALLEAPENPEAALALGRLLIEPLGLVEEVRRVFVAPAGDLSFVPYRLIDLDRDFVLVPSGTVLSVLAERSPDRGTDVLALGDAEYTDPDLVRLPETGNEARAVGDVVLLGQDATKSRLAAALRARPRWRSVHLAGHGRFDPALPQLSALLLTPGADDDGQLTALDVLRLDIPADLVVLSGCRTGQGKEYRSEGVVGLTRSFLASGANTVIVSLWPAGDKSTHVLMQRFYEFWKAGDGIPASEALRLAQDHVRSREEWRSPRHWAGWVIWGLGRPPASNSKR